MIMCLNLSPLSHLYQFRWKTKLKVVFEEEIKIEQEKCNEMQNKQVAFL